MAESKLKISTETFQAPLQPEKQHPERTPALQILVAWARVLSRLDGLESSISIIGPFLRRHFAADGFAMWVQENGSWHLSVASPSTLQEIVPAVTCLPEVPDQEREAGAPHVPFPYHARFDLIIATEAHEPLAWVCLLRLRAQPFDADEKQLLQEMMDLLSAHLLALTRVKQAQALALTDALTDIWNRRYFEQRYRDEFMRAHRYHRALAVLMIDLDGFKSYNDTYGHLTGDQVLQTVAQVLRANLRQSDVLCRYGGDEFVVLLPESDLAHALIVAEKLRLAIAAEPFPAGENRAVGGITVSIGVAAYTESGSDEQTILKNADNALYSAKKAGRNRIFGADKIGA